MENSQLRAPRAHPTYSPKTPPNTSLTNVADSTMPTIRQQYFRPTVSENQDSDETPKQTRPADHPTTHIDHHGSNPDNIRIHSQELSPQDVETEASGPPHPNPTLDNFPTGPREESRGAHGHRTGYNKAEVNNKKPKAGTTTKVKAKTKAKVKDQPGRENQHAPDQTLPQVPLDALEPREGGKASKKAKTRNTQLTIGRNEWVHSVLSRANNLYDLQELLGGMGRNSSQPTAMYPYTTMASTSVLPESLLPRPEENGHHDTSSDPLLRSHDQEQSTTNQENLNHDSREEDTGSERCRQTSHVSIRSRSSSLPGNQPPSEGRSQPLFSTQNSESITPQSSPLRVPPAHVDDVEMYSQESQHPPISSNERCPSQAEDDQYRQPSPATSEGFMYVDSRTHSYNEQSHGSQSAFNTAMPIGSHQSQAKPPVNPTSPSAEGYPRSYHSAPTTYEIPDDGHEPDAEADHERYEQRRPFDRGESNTYGQAEEGWYNDQQHDDQDEEQDYDDRDEEEPEYPNENLTELPQVRLHILSQSSCSNTSSSLPIKTFKISILYSPKI